MQYYFTLSQNENRTDLQYKMESIQSNSLGAAIEEFGKKHDLLFFNIEEKNLTKHVFYKDKLSGGTIEYEVNIII